MSNQAVHLAITGNASSLVNAAKTGARAIDGLENEARDTGRQLDDMGRGARTTGREVDDMGRSAERAARSTANLGRASHGVRAAGKVLALGSEKIVNQYTALAGGAGIGLAMKKQVELNDELTQMGIAARDAQGQVNGKNFSSWFDDTKSKIMGVSKTTGQGAEEMTAGMRAIIQRTGDMKMATEQLELMGVAATASGSSVEEMGGLIANLGQNVGLKGPEQMKQALTLLVAQGKTGAFEIKDMLSQGERMFTAMPNFRVQGMEGLKSFGAFVQVSRTANGNAETAAESIVSLGTAIAKLDDKKLAKAGIRGLKLKNSDGTKRSTEEIVKEIIKRTKGDMDGLIKANVFDEPAQRLIQKMANQYAKGEGFAAFDSFKNAGGDLSHNKMMDDDFSTRVNNTKFQLARLGTTMREFADRNLAAPLAQLTKVMAYLNGNAGLTDSLIKNITKGLIAMAAIAGSVKVYRMFQEFRSILGGSRGSAARGGLLGQVTGMDVQRVFVVNMGRGGMGLGGSGYPGNESYDLSKQQPAGAWSRWGRTAAIGGGIAGIGAVMAFAEDGNTPKGWGRALGGAAGVALGAFGGPIGMMIGQQIGDTVGGMLGEEIGSMRKNIEAEQSRKMREDWKDVTGKEKKREFLTRTDLTGTDQNRQRVAAGALKTGVGLGYQAASAADAKNAGITAKDLEKLNIVLNVETHVAKDGSTNTKVSQEKTTGFFKKATESLGPLTPGWAH